jgi:hypothetical protein
MKSGSLNLLEPSGPVQACNGIALPFINISNEMQLYLGFISRTLHVSVFHHAHEMEIHYNSLNQKPPTSQE